MERILKVLQIANQVVWIAVGLATLYFMYQLITKDPIKQLMEQLPNLINQSVQQQTSSQGAEVQKYLNQYFKQR